MNFILIKFQIIILKVIASNLVFSIFSMFFKGKKKSRLCLVHVLKTIINSYF